MIKEIFNQPAIQTLSPSAKKIHYCELTLIAIQHPLCRTIVSLQGAQLVSWTPTEAQRPILWLSEKAMFCPGKAIRGGIPICWPWFGSAHSPSHGFARLLDWTLISLEENQEGVKLQLGLRDSAKTHALWTHPFDATVILHLGKKAFIELSYHGHFKSTAALHTYFNIANIENTSVSGLGHRFQETRTSTQLDTPHDTQTFCQTIDRIYTHPGPISYLHDSDRIIKITHHNASDVVIWNPWREGAEKIEDMTAQGYKNMVCVETARINNPLVSTAESPATLAVTIETTE